MPAYHGTFGIGTAVIQDGAVTTAKIEDGAVTSAKIASGVIPSSLQDVLSATQAQANATVSQDVVGVRTDLGTFTMTLDSSAYGQGALVFIFDAGNNAGANPITIDDSDGDTIDGVSSITINFDGAGVMLRQDLQGDWTTTQIGHFTTVANQQYVEDVVTDATVTGAHTITVSDANIFEHTLTGNTTYTFAGEAGTPAGNSFLLVVSQDATGGRTITWPGEVEWDGGTTPTASTGANAKDMYAFASPDGGSTWIGVQSAATLS